MDNCSSAQKFCNDDDLGHYFVTWERAEKCVTRRKILTLVIDLANLCGLTFAHLSPLSILTRGDHLS